MRNALRAQDIVLPAGGQKIHRLGWMVQTSSAPRSMKELGDIPVKRVGNAVIYVHDVANVYRGGHPQTNLVLVQGRQGVEIVVMKSGDASTLDVVAQTKALLPRIEKIVQPDVHISVLSDASVFVKEAITDVVREMVTAAILTGLVVLLFLGSWRSTIIIATSIPLAILTAIICLLMTGQTINVMTLGGLALAVGILVDDATVMIENIDTHLEEGKDLEPAIIDAANQIVIPTLVSTLCICIVWTPLFRLSGVAGWLFMPMAEAIVYAMLASFILSRTLVPTMAKYLLAGQVHPGAHGDEHQALPKGFFGKFQNKFEHAFHVFRLAYGRFLERILVRRKLFVSCFLGASVLSLGLFLIAGQDFFPEVKSGMIQMHMRAPLGTRIETTGRIVSLVDNRIEALLPGKVSGIINNCGLPEGPHNQAFIPTPTIGTQDCDLTISLNDAESPVWDYRSLLRDKLSASFPGSVFTFQPADLTEKILNFGSPSPIDIQVSGPELRANYDYARILVNKLRSVPGAADVVIQQTMKTPTLFVKGNRTFSQATGMTEADIANNQLMTLSGSQTVDPQYWLDPKTGITFPLNVYVSQDQLTHYNDLLTIPVDKGDGDPGGKNMQLLGAISDVTAIGTPGEVSHFNSMPDIDIYVSAEGTDLGSVLAGVNKVIAQTKGDVPRSAVVDIHGQATTMHGAYNELIFGLIVSVVLIYMLIVVNFQSWVDPFIIISALPGALAGIAWSLFLTQTRLSVPALTGAIMCMGTATANSILVVAFAKERFAIHGRAITAAAEAGFGRIRPVIMTASAMIIGMVPMATSNSQNAPLGKAVIGGLIVATISTLLFVPCVYAIFHKNSDTPHGHETGEASENGKEAV